MEKWVLTTKRADFNKIASTHKISPVLARLIRNRDLINDEEIELYLNGSLKDIPSPYLLKDVKKAATIVREKIKQGKRIRIISDYDVDGVSSNYILWNGLKICGAQVDYRIPDRMEDGYGINENLIRQAKEDGIDTIVTCDNGIAAIDQIKYANENEMTVIVTDHHDIPYEEDGGVIQYKVPDAAAVVNPKQEDCSYPNKNICGAVVAYKFILVLLSECNIDLDKTMQDNFICMAALATVCDVMPLQGENRILVKEGLKRMQNPKIMGLRALMIANNLLSKQISCYHLGFVIGPCINASGRLKTAKEAMELLVCENEEEARVRAESLTRLNAERKEITNQGEIQAISYLEETGHAKDKVLIVYLKDCHESIAGIIAGRIRERYNKPVFVLTKSKDGIKGSGRSIEAYHMFEEMNKVKECFTKFGGHPMAAGLSMKEEDIEILRERLNINAKLTKEDFVAKVTIDFVVPFYYITEQFVEELDLLLPFGNGNKKPLFAQKNLEIISLRVLGSSGRCIKLYLKDSQGVGMDAMYFGDSQKFMEEMRDHYGYDVVDRVKRGLPANAKMRITYYPQINEYRGYRNMQVVIENYIFE